MGFASEPSGVCSDPVSGPRPGSLQLSRSPQEQRLARPFLQQPMCPPNPENRVSGGIVRTPTRHVGFPKRETGNGLRRGRVERTLGRESSDSGPRLDSSLRPA
ncbi:hypothetical protein LEMLEM_LOCUS5997 [Lemmus lemmus]